MVTVQPNFTPNVLQAIFSMFWIRRLFFRCDRKFFVQSNTAEGRKGWVAEAFLDFSLFQAKLLLIWCPEHAVYCTVFSILKGHRLRFLSRMMSFSSSKRFPSEEPTSRISKITSPYHLISKRDYLEFRYRLVDILTPEKLWKNAKHAPFWWNGHALRDGQIQFSIKIHLAWSDPSSKLAISEANI